MTILLISAMRTTDAGRAAWSASRARAEGIGFSGFVALLIWLVSIDAFSGRGNAVAPDPFFMVFMVLVACLSVLAGSFGLGLGLFAETKARLASNPNQLRVLARIATALGGTAVVGIVVLAMILVSSFRR